MKVEQIDAEFAFAEILDEIIDSKFDMSINWNQKFKEKLTYFIDQRFSDDQIDYVKKSI